MARDRANAEDYTRPVRRIVVAVVVVVCLLLFTVWRIDSPRVERIRAEVIDAVVPRMDWALLPVARAVQMFEGFESYARLHQQNQELRRELRQMRAWREAALQLEQRNARLMDLNAVQIDPELTFVTGVVLADSGSPFRQSVLLNVGARDGILDGWATVDGLGLVGRISGVGQTTSRVVLLTDTASRVPVTIQPSGQRAILTGDTGPLPLLEFIERPEDVRPGDRVVSSGDGGLFPAGVLVGQVAAGSDRRPRVALAADYARLDFLRVLRSHRTEPIRDPGALIPPPDSTGPVTGSPQDVLSGDAPAGDALPATAEAGDG
ncbi:MAG: rod shape-determining protein MreC [Rhodobacteraceae bacterium]|nr:rod shape-determining protein MreC [Paracoccaceae bacterium]